MSDPEVPKNEKHHDVDDVVGRANEGLDAAAAARADSTGGAGAAKPADPEMEAFAAAERDYPGTFGSSEAARDEPALTHEPASTADAAGDHSASAATSSAATTGAATTTDDADRTAAARAEAVRAEASHVGHTDAERTDTERTHADDAVIATAAAARADDRDASSGRTAGDETRVIDADREHHHPSVADTAYGASSASAAQTQVVPAEPMAPPATPQPIFVQAPEPPQELGNRGTAGAIGLVAAVAFAILYLGAILGFGALDGDVTAENVGTAALAPLTTWSFWVPVAVFFLSFWLLGAFINRARWGKWVIFGIFVALATYGGYILGQLFQEPFWRVPTSEAVELVNEQLLAPLAIASFVFARELTIWFGAWVARSGAKKKALNAEAQAEYERTLEAGPSALR